MRIPELSYPFEHDDRVYREAEVTIGEDTMAVQAVTIAGRPERGNQDAFGFYLDDERFCAAVFDGAMNRETSHIARDLLEESQGPESAREILSSVNQALGRYSLNDGASTGTILEITRARTIDIAHVTDSWAMALLHDSSTRLLTKDQHEKFDEVALQVMAQVAREEGCDMLTARRHPAVSEAIAKMFKTVRNAPDGAGEGILNGDPLMDDYIQTMEQPLDLTQTKMLLIGSDGARFPYQTEKDPTYRAYLFSLVGAYGVEDVVDLIHKEEKAKPPTLEYPRWSLHDDKSLVALLPV